MKLIFRDRLPGLNEINNANRRNPYVGAKMKKETQEGLIWIWNKYKNQTFPNKVNIRIHFYEPNERRDEDNVMAGGMKVILDALQKLKIIKNDSQKYVHVVPEVFVDRKNPRIEVDIEEEQHA
jgi:Holliday junction resolvase RusA-like endonuclease